MMHGSGNTVTNRRIADLFDEALRDGVEDSMCEALEALRRWRPRKVRPFLIDLIEQNCSAAKKGRLTLLMRDAMAIASDRIEQAVRLGEFSTGEEVIQATATLLFDDGILLDLVDREEYADVLSRDQVIALFDEALELRDKIRFGRAVDELLRYAIDAITALCRQDSTAAEDIAWRTIRPLVTSQFNDIWMELGKGHDTGEPSLPRSGQALVDLVMARLRGFQKGGRRIPGAIKKHWGGQDDSLLSLDVPAGKDDGSEGATWAETLPDPRAERPREGGQLASFVEGLQHKEMLDGQLEDLREFAKSLSSRALKDTARVLVQECQEARDRSAQAGITVYWLRTDSRIVPCAMERLAALLGLKQKKRIRDRVSEIEGLLDWANLTAPRGTPPELRGRMTRLLERVESEFGDSKQKQVSRANTRVSKTVHAVCAYLEEKLDSPDLDQASVIEIPLMCEESQRLLDGDLSQRIQERCGVSSDVARKRMSRLAKILREHGLLQKVN